MWSEKCILPCLQLTSKKYFWWSDEDPPPSFFYSKVEEWLMMILVMGNCLLDLFVVFDLDLEPIWVDNSCFCLFCFFVSQQLELNIIYFICFDNSMKKVIQSMCVDFCENIRSQDMYVKFPKIQSTYFVNGDIYCIYM